MSRKVFCVAYGGGHIRIVDLIARELQRAPDTELTILALTVAYPQVVHCYPAGVVKRLSDYLPLFDDILEEAVRHGFELLGDSHNPHSGIPKIESVAYLGLSFCDLVAEKGETAARSAYAEAQRKAFLPVGVLTRILEHERPDVVLTTNSPRCERAALMAANRLEIPTVQVVDLFDYVVPPPEAKHIVVMNERSAQAFRERGLGDREYYPFGQPVLDETAKAVQLTDATACRARLGIPADAKVLLLAAGPLMRFEKELSVGQRVPYDAVYPQLFELLRRVSEAEGAHVVVRIHPNERFEDYAPWFARYPQFHYANDRLDVTESLAVCDCLLTHFSTMGLQAIVCGKTVITYLHDCDGVAPLPRMTEPPFLFADGLNELEQVLCRALREGGSSRETHNFYTPGAAEKTVELVLRLADGHRAAVNVPARDRPE